MQSLIKILVPRQLFLLLILSTGLLNHVILIPNLLTAAGRDGWLSVIAAYPISILFLWLIYYIVRNSPDEGFFSLIRQRLGRSIHTILSFPVILYLFISSYITLQDLLIWLNAYFLAESSLFVIKLVMIFVCFLITLAGIKNMAITSGILLPIVMILGIMISIINTGVKDPNLLLPILADGYTPMLKGGIYVLSGLLEIYLVILLHPFSQESIKFKQLMILLFILSGLILGPLSASIMEFGPTEAENFRYPAYEQWRVLSIGDYISHMDFFALYQWLSGAFIRVGLFMFLLCTFFFSKKKHYRFNFMFVALMYILLFSVMLINFETYFFYKYLYAYFLPVSVVFFLMQIILSTFLIKVLKKRDERNGKHIKLQSNT